MGENVAKRNSREVELCDDFWGERVPDQIKLYSIKNFSPETYPPG